MKPKSLRTIIVLMAVFTFSVAGCKQYSPNKDDVKLKDVEALVAALPVHPSFQQTWKGSTSKSTVASVGRHYKSTARYDDVKSFYLSQLQSAGWRLKEERELKGDDGERLLTFSKEPYSFVIEYSGDKAVDPDWNYAVNVRWNSGRAY